jgi:hypothetical protein
MSYGDREWHVACVYDFASGSHCFLVQVSAPTPHLFIGQLWLMTIMGESMISRVTIAFDKQNAGVLYIVQCQRLQKECDPRRSFKENGATGRERWCDYADPIQRKGSLRRSAGSFYRTIALHDLFRGKTNAVTPVDCDLWMKLLDPLSYQCLAYPRGSGENYEWTRHSASSISDVKPGRQETTLRMGESHSVSSSF